MSYLTELTAYLLTHTAGINEENRKNYVDYFYSLQTADGGFVNRSGCADLYYTGFALRGLFLLNAVPQDNSRTIKLQMFLQMQNLHNLNAVEINTMIYCESLLQFVFGREISSERKEQYRQQLNKFKRKDNCFASSEKTPYSSTYHTFLSAVSFELLGLEEEKQRIPTAPILERQQKDGGFTELEILHRSGTNPTAAAVAFLKIRDTVPKEPEDAVRYLAGCQLSSGGFQANSIIGIADLLSSFTAWTALRDLNSTETVNFETLKHFVRNCKTADGGFCGSDWDTQSDAEYAFYGFVLESLLFQT
ncbi:beta-hydroxylase [Planctomycetales bacterium]|nr:beta-hydroxylase [Planctomycetales bacterium]